MKIKRILPLILTAALMVTLAAPARAEETQVSASLSLGASHGAAIASDGTLFTWGNNDNGQLGDGTTTATNTPKEVGGGFVFVAAGGTHRLVTTNTYGKLSGHTVAIKSDGTLWAWGENGSGQLGIGTRLQKNEPVQVMEDVVFAAAGSNFSMAVKSDGTLWAWGNNEHGQLGDGTRTTRLSPVQIMEDVSSASAGVYHAMAVGTDGTLWVWGGNDSGQIGDGTRMTRLSPVKILDDVAMAVAGGVCNAAVKTDGTLYTWGTNQYGQLGDGTRTDRLTPTKIMSDVSSVAIGGLYLSLSLTGSIETASVFNVYVGHGYAVKTDGTLWSWGFNNYGQLGDGTKADKNTPVKIMEDVAQVAAAGTMGAALKTNGEVYSWGYNLIGQLGDGTRTDKLSPVKILTGIGGANEDNIEKPQAEPTKQNVFVNGVQVSFDAYNIGGANYFKLRDLAMALRNTGKRFSVEFDSTTQTVGIGMNGVYSPIGGELTAGSGEAKYTQPSNHKVVIDGTPVSPEGYSIGGANYYKLRDIMKLINVFVDYDSASNSVIIDTNKGYAN